MNVRTTIGALCIAIATVATGCTPAGAPAPPETAAEAPSQRIPVPPEVVQNLGMTFEHAERGRLDHWLRVPGTLELPDDRRWSVRAAVDGRARLTVRTGETVRTGQTLGTLDSPALVEAQQAILDATYAKEFAAERSAAADARLTEAEELVHRAGRLESDVAARRQRLLDAAGGAPAGTSSLSGKERIEAEEAFVDAKARTLEAAVRRDALRERALDLRFEVRRAELEVDRRLLALSVLTGTSVEELSSFEGDAPVWRSLPRLELRSPGRGIVVSVDVAAGEHVETGASLLTIADPRTLAFRGRLPESDVIRCRPGAAVRVESAGTAEPVETALWESPPTYDPATRSIVVSAWVPNPDTRIPHGISATAHIRIAEGEREEVLLREDCVVFDGLEAIVFRRDSTDPNVVIRTPVELGERSGGRVEVLSGVLDGDEVVLHGVHQLKQTGQGKAPEGGHFHADGTWHEGD